MSEKTPRQAVIGLLEKVEKNAFSNLVLDGAFSDGDFSKQDKAFTVRLFYGVIERKLTLDYIISLYSKIPLQKIDREIRIILEAALYQLLYMDSVPDNSAVDEAVKLTRFTGKGSASGFVNAVLRGFIRDGREYPLPKDKIKAMSVKNSCSEGLVKRLADDYGTVKADAFLGSSLGEHRMFVRVNTTKISSEKLVRRFSEQGVATFISEAAEGCLELERLSDIEKNPLYNEGLFHVQDLSSQLCCKALDAEKSDRVLDVCAAPGGKTFTIAEMLDGGSVTACDIHDKRVRLIKNGAERLGLTNIEASANDAKVRNEKLGQFDRVLCDVPCSGTGVIRSKPEIKYADISRFEALPQIQHDILQTSSEYVKVGGTLIYSTCSVLKAENEEVAERFLAENSCFEPDEIPLFDRYAHTIFPEEFGCEGFFVSKFKRVK